MEIIRFDPATASRGEWTRYHVFRRERDTETEPEDPIVPDEPAEIRLAWPDPFNESVYFHAVQDGQILGEAQATAPRPNSPEYPSGRHILWAGGYVLRSHRRRGLGRALLEPLVEHMLARGATVLSLWSEEADGATGFMRWLGAELRFRGGDNRLDLARVDWDMVERWVREGEANTEGTRLELYQPRLPEEMLEAYAPAYSAMLNTTPMEDLDHGDEIQTPEHFRNQYALAERLGGIHHIALTREPDGVMSGMTEILYWPYLPDRVFQELTAVHVSQRGRGLGKWLKGAMLRLVRESYPQVRLVITQNAGSNAPMLGINEKLGFRQHRAQAEYQVSLESVSRRLAEVRSTS